jgi:uncharacterized protein
MNDIIGKIIKELQKIEQENDVNILYACESGSRAWGFESEDSDYDVRFIYLNKTEWYLSVDKKRDVIEVPINKDLDISGWDLQKTLQLLYKSNPPLLEWMQSPIVYKQNDLFINNFKKLVKYYYSPKSCMYHYMHMAQNNYREYLKGDLVRIKKYFYVLRPILACLWIENNLGIVPTEFSILVDKLITDRKLKYDINILIEDKKKGFESDMMPQIRSISEFISNNIDRISVENIFPYIKRDTEPLNSFFIDTLIHINGETFGGN